ncbi:MAG: mucoidy inhibitor MuiA family protein [Anaerolineae bacterium]
MEFTTAITSVTVFSHGARVVRRGQVHVPAGLIELTVSNLPESIVQDSLRVSGRGSAQAKLLGVDLRKIYLAAPIEAEQLALQNRLETLQQQKRTLELQNRLVVAQQEYLLNTLKAGAEQLPRGLAFGRSEVATGQELLSVSSSAITEADNRLLELERSQQDVCKELEQVQEQIANLGNNDIEKGYSAIIMMQVGQAGIVEVDLTYRVPGASWTPLYDIRMVEGTDPSVELSYLAEVVQSTGEAWDEVELTLSTAREHALTTIPELDPWYLHAEQPEGMSERSVNLKRAMPMAAPSPGLGAGLPMMYMEAEPVSPLEVSMAEILTSGPAVTYRTPQRITVPPDGTNHKTTVAILALQPKLDYVTAPKLEEAAYRRATVINTSAYHLLAGSANLFWGDEFLGKVTIKDNAPNESFELSLGVEERIKVTRKPNLRAVEKVMLRDIRKLRYGYEIELTNLMDTTIPLVLREQLPVSAHEKISVQQEEVRPAVSDRSDLGLMEWRLSLAAQGKQVISYTFTIQHPRDMTVTGLPPED